MRKSLPSPSKNSNLVKGLVVIGASAGGLAALTEFFSSFKKFPLDYCFIVAQHLSPTNKSYLTTLIGRETSIPVKWSTAGEKLRPGVIYVTPPEKNTAIKNGQIQLKISKTLNKPSIDLLFKSAAKEFGKDAVGIILSGTGTDGAIGISAISENKGLTLAQSIETADHDGMPKAAIDTKNVNKIARPSEMAAVIERYFKSGHKNTIESNAIPTTPESRILEKVEKYSGIDFANYKTATIFRRIARRVMQLKLRDITEYESYLADQPEELAELYQSFMINVTSFFRDKQAFAALRKKLEDLIRRKNPAEPIRIWVAGCSTGEEAYSISILLHEILGDTINKRSVQIFASDIDEAALRNGRKALFDADALKGIDKNLVAKYFNHTEQKYQLVKSCRSLVLFSKHDLTFHPPFLRMDLISCRNLLIYFNRELQDKVIATFNHSLNDKGLLFLGKSESIGNHKDSFLLLNEKNKLFSKKFRLAKRSSPVKLKKLASSPKISRSLANDPSVLEVLQNSFYESYEHPHVVVNEKMEMLQVRGEIAPYIGIGQGEMTRSLIKNAHSKLQLELRILVSRCISENKKVSSPLNTFQSGKQKEFVRIIAWPIRTLSKQNRLFVVSFEKANPADFPFNFSKKGDKIVNAENLRIRFLEDELAHTKENLQAFIEEVETSNEELQSLSEEVQSANEELQAANEELETSNEELQSANEEMAVSFNELREVHRLLEEKDALMRSAHYKLQAIMDNSLQGYLLIDNKYIIASLNNAASQIIPMFSKQVLKVGDSFINAMPANAIAVFKENFDKAWAGEITMRDIQLSPEATLNEKEIWLHVRYAPVYGPNNKIEHVLISYYDISIEVNAQTKLKNNEAKFRALSENSKDMTTINAANGSILYASPAVSSVLGYSSEELMKLSVTDLIHPEDIESFTEKTESIMPAPGKTFNNEHRILHKNGQWLWCEATITNMIHEPEIRGFVSNFRNITERWTAQLALSKSEAFSRGVLDSLSSHIAVVDKTGLIVEVNKAWSQFAKSNGPTQMDRTGKGSNYFDVCKSAISASDETAAQALNGMLEVLNKSKDIFYMEYPCHSETEQMWFGMRVLAFENDDSMIVVEHRDITDRKVAEAEIKYKANLLDMVEQAIITTDLRGLVTYWNKAAENTFECKAEDAKGKNIVRIIPNAKSFGNARKIINMLKEGQSLSGEFITLKKSGEQFPVGFTNSPIYNEAGEIIGVISVSRDITNRKNREAEREKMIQDLIYRNKNMEQFSFIISHNLRGPVANILGLANLIKIQAFSPEESPGIFSGICTSAQKLDEIVKDLNEILTLKSNTFEQKEYVYFQSIVEDVVHTLDPVIKKENVRIETDFVETDKLLSVKSYVLSIFYNLINNSIKYNKPGMNPDIKIKSKKTAGGVQLIFKDNGLGIDLEKQGEKVFGLYKRFHIHKEGKGMGLFMVKTQTETLGGKVSVKSEVNKGTEFILEFNTSEA